MDVVKKRKKGGETWINELAAKYGNILTQVNLAQKKLHCSFQIYYISLFFLCPKHTHELGAAAAAGHIGGGCNHYLSMQ